MIAGSNTSKYCVPFTFQNNETFLQFLENPIFNNEINQTQIPSFYREFASEISFETWAYTAYGSLEKTDKSEVSDDGKVF